MQRMSPQEFREHVINKLAIIETTLKDRFKEHDGRLDKVETGRNIVAGGIVVSLVGVVISIALRLFLK